MSSRTLPGHVWFRSRFCAADGQAAVGQVLAGDEDVDVVRHQLGDVLAVLAQRRYGERNDVEQVVEILAQPRGGDGSDDVAAARGHDPHVQRRRRGAVEAEEGSVPERGDEAGLEFRVHVRDVFEKERATIRTLDRAVVDARSVLDPEELGLAGGTDESGDVDPDEGPGRTPAVGVEVACDQLLPAPRLSGDEHGGVVLGDASGPVPEGADDRAAPDGLRDPRCFMPQPDVLPPERRRFERAADRQQELRHGQWFFEEVVCAEARGLDRGLHRAWPDIMITGAPPVPLSDHSRNREIPSESGIQMSRRMRSGRRLRRAARADSASFARQTS